MKRSGFLRTLGALFLAPKLIEAKTNTYDSNEYLSYRDFAKKYPLTPEECFQLNEPTKDSYDGFKVSTFMADECGPYDPKNMADLWRTTGTIPYKK